jgi:hypothetical protein
MAGSRPGCGRTMAVVRCSVRQLSHRTARSRPCSVFSGTERVLRTWHFGQFQFICRFVIMAGAIVVRASEKRVKVR